MDNIGVKLIALVVALMVWFNASSQQTDKRDFLASLKFVNVPDSLVIVGPIPTEVEISISGTRRELLFTSFRKITMMVNMARATSGRFTQRLAVSDILLPPGIEPGDVRVVSPTSVNTRLDRLVTKRLRANVILSGSLPADLLFNRVPDASPIWVEVTGPESLVKPMDKVPTRPVELSRVRESVNREVALDYDERSLTCVPDRVTV
jgi:YbbR domain-containing protein